MKSFVSEIMAHGLMPPAHIEPGKIHRFPGVGKKRGNKAGWCRLFPDGQGGVFGDWSTGLQLTWQDHNAKRDNVDWLRQVREAKRLAKQGRKREQDAAAAKSVRLWGVAWPIPSHAYLTAKQIQAHGTKGDKHGNLLVPVYVGGKLSSLQFIKPDGTKFFLRDGKTRGGYFRIGDESDTILIAEGFATAATLFEDTRECTYAAFNAGNLTPVAHWVRLQHPEAAIIVCGDNDHAKAGNPGKTAAIEAAKSIGAKWAVPDFSGLEHGPKDTDVNDYKRLQWGEGGK